MRSFREGIMKPLLALAAFAVAVGANVSVQPAVAEENSGTTPSYYVSAGAGGIFYDYGEEVDETWTFEAKFGARFTPAFGTEFTFGGLPHVNNRTYVQPNSAKQLDDDTSALKYDLAFMYYPLEDPADTIDPFVNLSIGTLDYGDDLEHGQNDPYFGMGIGTFYNFDANWFARADYKIVNMMHDGEWNQHTLLSFGYRWGAGLGGAEATGRKSGNEDEDALRGRKSPLQTVYFAFDSAKLDDTAQGLLRENADWLKKNPGSKVTLEGHCDERGTNEYNLALGERRAKSAEKFLRNLGIPQTQMTIQSFGEEFPADPGHNETAWAKNRRVEFRER